MPSNLGKLILRMVTGLLLAGHGSQKLFGWFGGQGMEERGMANRSARPQTMGVFAGLSEFAVEFSHPRISPPYRPDSPDGAHVDGDCEGPLEQTDL